MQSSGVNCQDYYSLTFSNAYDIPSLYGDLGISKTTPKTARSSGDYPLKYFL